MIVEEQIRKLNITKEWIERKIHLLQSAQWEDFSEVRQKEYPLAYMVMSRFESEDDCLLAEEAGDVNQYKAVYVLSEKKTKGYPVREERQAPMWRHIM